MNRVALATVILSAIALTAGAQPPRDRSSSPAPPSSAAPPSSPAPTRVLAGRVVANETGDPIANARVSLRTTGPGVPVVLTNHEGRFTLTAAPMRLTVVASKSGYGRRETIVAVTDPSVEIRLSRGAAISGRVVDEFGEPIWGARVLVENAAATSETPASEASTETDDRGEYRLGSLPSGSFRVATVTIGAMIWQDVGANQIMMPGRPEKTYYPAVKAATDAETLRLHPGDERSAIDFVVPGGQSMQNTFAFVPPRDDADAAAPLHTGVIRGRVVSTDGRGLSHAQVRALARVATTTAAGTGQTVVFQPTMVTADGDGRFEMPGLAAGSFRLSASKVGYSTPDAPVAIGFPGVNAGIPIELGEGDTRERVDITLARWGAMTGHVFDELGDPLQGASVQLLRVRYQAGRRRLVPANGRSLPTDDLGRFRISAAPPGQYIVSATIGGVASADLPGYGRSYFPGTPDAAEAQFVSLKLSEDTSSIDFSLSRTTTVRVSGTMIDAAGEPSTGGSVRLTPSLRSTSVTTVQVGARILPDGRFEFPNVTPGQYIIHVDRGRKNASTEGELGVLPVVVADRDVTDLVVQTSAGSAIAGRVTFEAFLGTRLPRPGQIEITPVPTDPERAPNAPASADIRSDWSFVINGVNGPRRLELRRAPAGWMLKEIRVRGIDVADRPLMFGTTKESLTEVEVVLTDRINELTGAIADDHAAPAPGSHLILFSTDRDRWYPGSRFLRHAITGAGGAFGLASVPPGSYYAAAVATIPPDGNDAWEEPAYLESLVAHSRELSFGDGQKQILNLKLP
jgi:hypothetical protein